MSEFRDFIKEIATGAFNKSELTLSGQGLDDAQIFLLCDAVIKNPYIKNIDLSYNQLSGKGFKALMSLEKLESLNVSNNKITIEIQEDACQSKLQKLDISGNPIAAAGISFFSENSTIKELTARNCEIEGPGLNALFEFNSCLEKLDVSYNRIEDDGLRMLPQSKSITSLNLSANRITHIGADFIYGIIP